MLSAMGPSAVTAIRMPSDGRRTSGAAVPPEEESEGLCAGALLGTAGMWTAGWRIWAVARKNAAEADRSEEHTSELQSLMRISYAGFCLKKKKNNTAKTTM